MSEHPVTPVLVAPTKDTLRTVFVLGIFIFSMTVLFLTFIGIVTPTTDTQKEVLTISIAVFSTVAMAGMGKWLFPEQASARGK